jgi:hypothetical protein
VEDNDAMTYAMIPHRWVDRIVNRPDFLGALAIDLWTNNCDRRQAIFRTVEDSDAIFASFIDHGHMFGGERHCEKTCPKRCMIRDMAYYWSLFKPENVSEWINRIHAIDSGEIGRVLNMIPEDWADGSVKEHIGEVLSSRKPKLASLLDEAKNVAKLDISFQYHGLRAATEPNLLSHPLLRAHYA